ncbi:hypothetical protein BCR43DRAFT_516563 [Syncephalastrum racemosum]|uniref:F-box domain-containing protein n=1 Tax=Syncephalastrum racemosum TaxID=13706 RepID=A0A1X2H8Q8_SYNRA|nr:hypothetical protein BCR43DRAFT_516563 [Syncephalastrum racemosum]
MDQDPAYPLNLLPRELQVEIFRNDARSLTVAMQVNGAWQGQLEPLRETFTELNIDLSDRRLQYGFGEAVLAFFHRGLTSISVKTLDIPWWLYNAMNTSMHRTRVTHLDITSWHRHGDLSRDLIFRRVLPEDFFFAVFGNLTSLYMETDDRQNVHTILQACPNLLVLTSLNRKAYLPDQGFERHGPVVPHESLRALQISAWAYSTVDVRVSAPELPNLQVLRVLDQRFYQQQEVARLKSLYVGPQRVDNRLMQDMVVQLAHVDGVQHVDLEARCGFPVQNLVQFFEFAARTLTRLHLKKMSLVEALVSSELIRVSLQSLVQLEIQNSSRGRGDSATILLRLLTHTYNLQSLQLMGFNRDTVKKVFGAVVELRWLTTLSMLDIQGGGFRVRLEISIAVLGDLPGLQHLTITGMPVKEVRMFVERLHRSGGYDSLISIRVQHWFPRKARQHVQLFRDCRQLQLADMGHGATFP